MRASPNSYDNDVIALGQRAGSFETSSGNVFADLGLAEDWSDWAAAYRILQERLSLFADERSSDSGSWAELRAAE